MLRRKRSQRQARYTGFQLYVVGWEHELWQTMGRNDVSYTIADKVRGPQVFTFRLRLADPGRLPKVIGLGEQLALGLGVPAVRVSRRLGLVDVEISLAPSFHRPLPVKALHRKGRTWVALGQTAVGTPVHVNLSGTRTCHALISGTTGSGKTVTEQLIAWTLAADNDPGSVRLLLVDGKGGTSWWGFEREAHLAHPVIGDPNEAVAALTWCVTELDRRKISGQKTPALFVVIDEVRELLDVGGEPVAESIRRIASLGRELDMHIIVATQHALADALGGSIAKANLPLRLAGRVADASAAYVATGIKGSGAETLQGNGDFLLTVAGELHRLQIALVGNREFGRLPRVETTPKLDFGEYDPERVLGVVERPKADPLDPEQVATALARDRGIRWLKESLGVGQAKATRIRRFAQAISEKLDELGYGVYPVSGT